MGVQTLNDRYRLDAEIGRGGLGIIYRAYDILLDRPVAVKVLSNSGVGTEGRRRLLHEARAAARLNHPNIVSIYDAGEATSVHELEPGDTPSPQDVSFIIMELVEGDSLHDQPPGSLEDLYQIVIQVCAALEHAHRQGIIHRDLKPENVIITPKKVAKLTDFGLARSLASRMTVEGAILGTVFYLSPEQALGKEIDARTDLYALGVLVYELAANRLPFFGDDPLAVISQHLYSPAVPPSTYNPAIPPFLDGLILKLLSKLPEDRPSSAGEVARLFQQLLETGGQSIEQAGAISPLDQLVRGRLVGRERELAEAREFWWKGSAGLGHENILVVDGESGIGKTPFVRELVTLAEVSGAKTFLSECYAEGGAPYGPFAQILRDALGQPGLELPPAVLADLVALAPDLRERYELILPAGLFPSQPEQHRIFDSVVTLATVLSARSPLLLVIEDIQWADAGTLSLVRHLARRARASRLRLMVLQTYRTSEVDNACCLSDFLADLIREKLVFSIHLQPYDRGRTHELLNSMFGQEVSLAFVESIYSVTEGNLFFIEEICKGLIEAGTVQRQNGRWILTESATSIELPHSVRLAIQARVSKLSPTAQEALRIAAVIGREFDFEILSRASEQDEETLIEALECAEQAQLIAEEWSNPSPLSGNGHERFSFAHGLIATSLRESLSSLRRHRLHRRVAAVIEAIHPEDYEEIAYHYQAGGEIQQARAYLIKAGDRARRLYANQDAIKFYTQALENMPEDDPDRFRILVARSAVNEVIGDRASQKADVDALQKIAERSGDDSLRCEALISLVDYYLATEFIQAIEPARQAVALADALADPVRQGHALRRLGWAAWITGDYLTSRETLTASVDRFRESSLPGEAAISLHFLSLVLGGQGEGDLTAAQKAAAEAVALSRQDGDRRQEANSLRRLAITYLDLHDYQSAIKYAEEALTLHRQSGDREGECNALNVLGIAFGYLGELGQASERLFQALEIAHAIQFVNGIYLVVQNLINFHFTPSGDLEAALKFIDGQEEKAISSKEEYLCWVLRLQRAEIFMNLGQYRLALDIVQDALRSEESWMNSTTQAQCLILLALIQAEMQDPGAARVSVELAAKLASKESRPGIQAKVSSTAAYIAWLDGDEEHLRRELENTEESLRLLHDIQWEYDRYELQLMAALLHLALGDGEAALKKSEQAIGIIDSLPIPEEKAYLLHSRALREAGRQDEANRYLRRAYDRLLQVADKLTNPEYRRSLLEDMRVHKEILIDWARYGS